MNNLLSKYNFSIKVYFNIRIFLYVATICLFNLFHNCIPYEEKIPAWDAQTQVNAASEFKAKQCNSVTPQPPLYVFTDQEKRSLDLCTIAITRMDCPFYEYPVICLGLYIKSPTPEIPWYLNFNELTKVRFKP